MFTPVVRMVQAAAEDTDLGVWAQLDKIEYDEGDTKPTLAAILSTTDDNEAAAGPPDSDQTTIQNWPVLIIAVEMAAGLKITGVIGKSFDAPNLRVHIFYVTADTNEYARAWRDCDYTFRAFILALKFTLFAADGAARRKRANVQIQNHNNISYGPAFVRAGKGLVVGQCTLDLWVRVNP